MKKTLKLFGLVALAAIAFSCTQKDNPVTPSTSTDETTPAEEQTEEPAIVPATDGGLLTSFGVTIGSEATKVSVDLSDGTTAIENGDEVLVFASGDNSAIYVYDGAQFVLKDGETAVTVNTETGVYYPANEYVKAESAVQLILPAGIEANGDKLVAVNNPMAGVITGEAGNYSVMLNNLTSVLRVKVSADVNINSVALDFGSVNYAAGAKFTVNPTTSELTFASGTATSETIALGTPAKKTADVLFLLPAIELTNGLTVTANLAENHNGGTDSFSISKEAYTPIVNKISTMSFYAGLFSGGAGTPGDPYIIANARDFKHISVYCKNGYRDAAGFRAADFLGANYQQTADINFGGKNITDYLIAGMVGDVPTAFSGTYNGKNSGVQYTLSNFTVSGTPKKYDIDSDGTDDDVEGIALFKRVVDAKLLNIAISKAVIYGDKFTAGLAGHASGSELNIEGCSISGSELESTDDYGVGGLVGGLYGGTVTGCSGTNMTISTSGNNKQFFGGIICYINGTVTVSGCELNGTTTVNKATKFGGIVGSIANAGVEIKNCHNHSTINASTNYMGGICGNVVLGTISGCTNDGEINANSSAAGIVATLAGDTVDDAMVTGCVNTGNINAANSYAGGVVAFITRGHIKNSRSDATVIAAVDHAGGLIGAISGNNGTRVNSCFAKGNVKGSSNVGGFIGNMQAGSAYIVNSLAACNVVATSKDNNQAVGGFVGRIQNSANGKNAWIGNCAVYDVIVKAPNQTSTTKPVRVGGFVGVNNYTTSRQNTIIQNCYYQGVAENLGYGGTEDFTTKPTTINGGYHGGIAGYAAGYLLDCYSTPKIKANGTGGTYTNNTQLSQEFIYGNNNSNPEISTAACTYTKTTSKTIAANTATLGGVLSAVDATYSSMAFSDWASYEEDGKYYYYPASLTGLGEAFYKK